MADWSEIQKWLKSLGSMYEAYIPTFESNGFDEWEIIGDLIVSDLTSTGIKLGHAKKIIKHKYVNKRNDEYKSESPSVSAPSQNNTTHDAQLFNKLMSRKSKQKHQYMKFLEENKFIHKKPHYLHRKCSDAYFTPRKTTKKLSSKNKVYNKHVLDINEEADLNELHWNSTKVNVEATFRGTIEKRENQIDESLNKVDLTTAVSSIYIVPKNKNTQTKINTKAKDIMKDKQTIRDACLELTELTNKTNEHLLNTLKIIDNNENALTYKSTKGSFWKTKQTDQIKDRKVLQHHRDNINKWQRRTIKLQERINEINNDKNYKNVAQRARKKLKSNEDARLRMNLWNKNAKYRVNTAQNIERMKNTPNELYTNNNENILFSFVQHTSQVNWHKKKEKRTYSNWIIFEICNFLELSDINAIKLTCKILNSYFLFVQQIPYRYMSINKDKTNICYRLGIFKHNEYDAAKKGKLRPNQYRLRSKSQILTKLYKNTDLQLDDDPTLDWVSEEDEKQMLTIRHFV